MEISILFAYFWGVFVNWWWLVTVILFGLDKFAEWVWPPYRTWLSENFSSETRRRFFWRAVFGFVFVSGFLAWRDEYVARLEAEAKISAASLSEAGLLKAVSDLRRFEKINSFAKDNTIILHDEPIPESVKVFLGAKILRPGKNYFRIERNQMIVEPWLFDVMKKHVADGYVIDVEYMKTIK